MGTWEALGVELEALWSARPPVVRSSPAPDSLRAGRRGRCEIELAAHAEEVAAGLHARYAGLVDLTVGAMSYPHPTAPRTRSYHRPERRVDSRDVGLSVGYRSAAGTPAVRSGFDATFDVRVQNESDQDFYLQTNGVLASYVVNADGGVVGVYCGIRAAILQVISVPAGEAAIPPLLVGTDSLDPELGYAVPAGSWQIIVELVVGPDLSSDGPSSQESTVWSGPLPLLVTT